ncbi:MAG: ABC transporter ATP-binding protein [Candidatus Viridilinea halotolerans]|uniref:ABC-type quaternary amine transporter n=1 Tax=Candidatus Viridilinea halotolerans TaxID=2491704 RepID=A0A426U8I2_9CHLR|nr:MAG: ABC transporter ATP-binding protein [Candidatus Viridilinea halotolerans]
MFLELQTISCSYHETPVLRGVNLAVAEGSITALLGPSGCGKTTLLRVVAGLERTAAGTVLLEGQTLAGVPPYRRGFGLMFQDYALFPHLDVAGNIAFGLQVQGQGRSAAQRVTELLALVGLEGYERRRVYELSGGERQRVALARALAPRPRLLMLDEPLAALDRALRERLQDELHAILRQVGVTTLYVTHDQEEAFALADQVALLHEGQLEQSGTPEAVYQQPASLWAAHFLGLNNVVQGHWGADGRVTTPLGHWACRHSGPVSAPGSAVSLVIYPDAAQFTPEAPCMVTLLTCQFRGRSYRVVVRHASGLELRFDLPHAPAAAGMACGLALDPTRIYALAAR